MAVQARRPLQVHSTQLSSTFARSYGDEVIPGFARPPESASREEWAAAFEDAYASAGGNLSLVPWLRSGPDPELLGWLDACAPGLLRPGASVVIVGCGAGDDAAELAARGYDLTAFDLSSTAIDWARRRFPHLADCFRQADLLDPARRIPRADLVVEVELLSWLPPELRSAAAGAIASLVRPRGMVLSVCTAAPAANPSAPADGPADASEGPVGLSVDELTSLMAEHGLAPIDQSSFLRTSADGRLCICFRRA